MRGGNTSLALKASVFKRIVFSAYCFSLLADIILLSYPIKEAIRVSVHEIEKRPFISLIAPPLGQCNSVKDFMFTITQEVNRNPPCGVTLATHRGADARHEASNILRINTA